MKKIYIAPTTDIEKNFTLQPFMDGFSMPSTIEERTDPANPEETLTHEGVWDKEW